MKHQANESHSLKYQLNYTYISGSLNGFALPERVIAFLYIRNHIKRSPYQITFRKKIIPTLRAG